MKSKISFVFITMLCLTMAIGLLASDIYLPAMPSIASSLHVEIVKVQQTLGIYLLGLSISQLYCGPLSDRWGRKKTLVAGLITFVLASFGCALAHTIEQLIAARFFQSLGACTGAVVGKAVIGDMCKREEAAKILAVIFPLIGMSPAIAPIIGGYLTMFYSWHMIFLFIGMLGIVLLLLVIGCMQESRLSRSLAVTSVYRNYLVILKHPLFIGYTAIVCAACAAYYAYLAESPFIFHQYGFASQQIGYLYIVLSLCYFTGNMISRRLLNYISLDAALSIGIMISFCGGVGLTINAILETNNVLTMIIPMSILSIGNGFIMPLGTAGGITLFPNISGSVSGLMGFFQMGAASVASIFVGYLNHDLIFSMSLFIVVTMLMGASAFFAFFLSYKRVKAFALIGDQ